MEPQLGKHHSGQMRQESAQAKAEPAKLALAARLRRETTLTVRPIAQRLLRGSWRSLNSKLYLRRKAEEADKSVKL